MKSSSKPYFVILWNENTKSIEHYDIMPYLIQAYKDDKKSKSIYAVHPTTFEEFKKFILSKTQYMYRARCEYEVIISNWPRKDHEYKLDVYEQIKMNIDVIVNHFISCLNINNKKSNI